MAVTSMPFVRLPKARTSARVKQALEETGNTAKVMSLLVCSINIHICSSKPSEVQRGITEFGMF